MDVPDADRSGLSLVGFTCGNVAAEMAARLAFKRATLFDALALSAELGTGERSFASLSPEQQRQVLYTARAHELMSASGALFTLQRVVDEM